MRSPANLTLLWLFVLACAFPALAQSFPAIPVTPERPLSGVVSTAAVDAQMFTRVATNGEIALVVWADRRAGTWDTYAARMDAGGAILDPLGVRIADGSQSVGAVVWDGRDFVVVLGRKLLFVAPDMTIAATKSVDLPPTYGFAAATSGANPRFLYLEPILGIANAAVADIDGNVIGRRPFWSNPPNWMNGSWTAAGNDSGFVVLREIRENVTGNGRRILAERIDDNANPLTSSESLLPFNVISGAEALAGGDRNFLLVQQSVDDGSVTGYMLDANGVYRGDKRILAAGSPGVRYISGYKPAVVHEVGRYVAAWHTSYLNGVSEERVGEVGEDGPVSVRLMYQWAGITADVALTSSLGRRFVATSVNRLGSSSSFDIFASSLSPSLQPDDPRLVTFSGTMQANVQMAAGANGYALTWAEAGPDNAVRLYLRRLSPSGVPQDAAPIVLQTLPFDPLWQTSLRAKIVSNGATYVAGWITAQGYVIRRLDARSGAWIDPAPVLLPKQGAPDLASNSTDAMAVSIGTCDDSTFWRCLYATRIPMSGAPPAAPVTSFHAAPNSADPVIASNGAEYLVAWTDPIICPGIPCSGKPAELYAVRLRADGTSHESTAALLLGNGFATQPSVASAGGGYLVVWYDGWVRGTRVTAEGAVLDHNADGSGVVLASLKPDEDRTPRAISLERRFGLLTSKQQPLSQIGPVHVTWEGVAFTPDTDLARVAALPRSLLFDVPNGSFFTLAPVFRDGVLGVGYSRVGESGAGNVSRAFFRAFAELARRHATIH